MLRTPFGFHPYFCKGSNRCGTFRGRRRLVPPLFSSSSFPSATTSPLNSWHSQDAIDNPWYLFANILISWASQPCASDGPAFKIRKYEKLTEKENWEIHSDSFVEIYSTPQKISTAAGNQISRREECFFVRNLEEKKLHLWILLAILIIDVRYGMALPFFTRMAQSLLFFPFFLF